MADGKQSSWVSRRYRVLLLRLPHIKMLHLGCSGDSSRIVAGHVSSGSPHFARTVERKLHAVLSEAITSATEVCANQQDRIWKLHKAGYLNTYLYWRHINP